MHFVCVYTTGRNVWLLLKYYLHGFAKEEKSLYSSQQISLVVLSQFGVCVSVFPKHPGRWMAALLGDPRWT